VKARLTRLVGLVLTVVFLVLALQRVDLQGFVDELRHFNYVWLFPSALCTLLGYVLRTVRWRVILSGAARAPFTTLFPVLIMGFATNNILPGRLGEFWRAYLLGRKRNVRKTFALASVVVERVFDGLTLIALLAVVSMAIQLPDKGREVELIAGAIFLAATLGLVVLLWKPAVVQVPLRRVLAPFHGGLAAWRPGSRSASRHSSMASVRCDARRCSYSRLGSRPACGSSRVARMCCSAVD